MERAEGGAGALEQRGGKELLNIHRLNDNELVLFDERARESWIVYPPRSLYEHLRRPSADTTIVEHHPWAPLSVPIFHYVRVRETCVEHGLACGAARAIQSGVEAGWDPFR